MQPTELTLTRIIPAPREEVFAAWTDPELLKEWWGPGPVTCPEAHVDLREGGAYRLANLRDRRLDHLDLRPLRARAARRRSWSTPGTSRSCRASRRWCACSSLPHPRWHRASCSRHERFAIEAVRDMHLRGLGRSASTSSKPCWQPDEPGEPPLRERVAFGLGRTPGERINTHCGSLLPLSGEGLGYRRHSSPASSSDARNARSEDPEVC